FSSRRRHTRFSRDWSSDVCSSDLLDPKEFDDRSYVYYGYATEDEVVFSTMIIGVHTVINPDYGGNPMNKGNDITVSDLVIGHMEIGRASCRERRVVGVGCVGVEE